MHHARPRPIDWMTVGYLAWLSLALLASPRRPPTWPLYVAAHGLASTLILWAAHRRSRLWRPAAVIYDWYPVWAIGVVFEELRDLIWLVTPRWYDELLFATDTKLFGRFPPLSLERLYHPAFTELVMLGYFSYYFIPYLLCLPLYRRRDRGAFHETATAIFLSFLLSLVLFLLFPAQGPRQYFPHLRTRPLVGYLITAFEHRLVEMGGLVGGAFPSSHCAVAMAALLQARRYHRLLWRVFLGVVPLLSFATVYGWYHYVSDVVAGWLVGIGAVLIARRLCGPSQDQGPTAGLRGRN